LRKPILKETTPISFKDNTSATFMDPKTYEQTEIPLMVLGNQAAFLKKERALMFILGRKSPLG
jgi:translation elongation factor P/translation initiation factor 5A